MHRAISATLAAASLMLAAGCQTTPAPEKSSPASVAQPRNPVAGAAKPRADIRPVERPEIAALDVSAARKDPAGALKDPKSILSKRSIYFDYDRFDIEDDYWAVLDAHAKYLRENPAAKALIQGNADERGSREYNLALGQKRSDSVKNTLLLLGAKEAQIEAVSLGEEKPSCREHSEDCRSKNRRGDILYGGEF
jgi:peptidoglycan-associated lipoprotein